MRNSENEAKILTLTSGVAGWRGNLGIILVRMHCPAFQNPPNSYTWALTKRDPFIYLLFKIVSRENHQLIVIQIRVQNTKSRGTIFNPIMYRGRGKYAFFWACADSNYCKQDMDGFTCQVKLKIYTFSWKGIKNVAVRSIK